MKRMLLILLALPLAMQGMQSQSDGWQYGNPHYGTPGKNYPIDAAAWRRAGHGVVIASGESHDFPINKTFFVENLSADNQVLNVRLSDRLTTIQIILNPGEVRAGIPRNAISIWLDGKNKNRLRLSEKIRGVIITEDSTLKAAKSNRSATAP